MRSPEFWFSVLASVVAAAVLEATGATNAFQYLRRSAELPLWAVFLLVATPIALSLLWFRKSVTPAHVKLTANFNDLEAKYKILEANLYSLRLAATAQETLLNEANEVKRSMAEELEDWKNRGIKLHREGDQLEQIARRTYGVEIVDMDGKAFVGCTFQGSILRFKGIAPTSLEHIEMYDVRWVMDTPASNAFGLLGAMYKSGAPELRKLVENTFENIRSGQVGPPGAKQRENPDA